MIFRAAAFLFCHALTVAACAATFELQRDAGARFRFGGFAGERIAAGVEHWLLPAPEANPGMLEMFRVRDREPVPNLVPWAGEFVGKYLISAIQTERLGHPELRGKIERVVRELIATQAEDGYLGPFRKEERLLGHWDLWGHYHALLALLMWHEQSGDEAALGCARGAADLVCRTYLDSGKRMIEAGSDEMNLSIIHALGWLHRTTREERYLRMMREIEKDWEKGGDFVNKALAGVEFFETPRPRWESLHSLQGLVELYRITGEEKYRRAFEHYWRSIARWDVRNTGGFSSGEQATGNPYAPTAIETCCSIAWMAMSVDMLELTGDASVADALERATWNAWAGAQHPSGRWCTYSTPMDGRREASAHAIVFQARAGTPELNCCSVNGPRGWGMLADWAVMRKDDGLALNWLGPGEFNGSLADGGEVSIRVAGKYPAENAARITVSCAAEAEFDLHVRIPGWAEGAVLTIGPETIQVMPGAYFSRRAKWNGQELVLRLPMELRAVTGANEARGKISVYRGPLLLAWDQQYNEFDQARIPRMAPKDLKSAVIFQQPGAMVSARLPTQPELTLVDFASAGARGTHYASWLPGTNLPPAPAVMRRPRDGAELPPGQALFRWTAPQREAASRIEFSSKARFTNKIVEMAVEGKQALVLTDQFAAGEWIYWRVATRNEEGETVPWGPPSRFRVDRSLPRKDDILPASRLGKEGEVVRARLAGKPAPEFGEWERGTNWSAEANAVRLNGKDQKLIYRAGDWPEESYAVTLQFRVDAWPEGRMGQLFSAWAGPMDDPLRLTVENGRLFARMEAGGAYTTPGAKLGLGKWHAVTAVRDRGRLSLVVDGKEQGSTAVPAFAVTRAQDFAIGGNPHYAGDEHLAVTVRDLVFYGRALEGQAPH